MSRETAEGLIPKVVTDSQVAECNTCPTAPGAGLNLKRHRRAAVDPRGGGDGCRGVRPGIHS